MIWWYYYKIDFSKNEEKNYLGSETTFIVTINGSCHKTLTKDMPWKRLLASEFSLILYKKRFGSQ